MSDKNNTGIWAGVAIAVLAVAAGAYVYMGKNVVKPSAVTVPAVLIKAPDASATAAPQATPSTVVVAPKAELSNSELLKSAATALGEGRLISPPGNNAVEYYLLVIEKDPDNNAARDGLREMFPVATGAIEQEINAGQIEDGMREINLLAKADPNNYTLTILRAKLDLKKKQVDREQEKRDQEKILATNALKNSQTPSAAATPVAAAATPAPTVATPITTPPPAAAPAPIAAAPAAQVVTAAPAPVLAPAPAVPLGTRAATLLNKVNPSYPITAARNHVEGWVEVSFTITADGHVKDASVVSANPQSVFNAAALQSVSSWTFQPRVEAGKAVEQKMRSRIEFKL